MKLVERPQIFETIVCAVKVEQRRERELHGQSSNTLRSPEPQQGRLIAAR